MTCRLGARNGLDLGNIRALGATIGARENASAGLRGRANEDLVQCHSSGARDCEDDDLGDVLWSDRELLDERLSRFSGLVVGDVACQLGGDGPGARLR